MINVGVIGYGYWGPNLVRNFSEVEGARVTAVADLKISNLEKAAKRYPSLRTTSDIGELLKDPKIDAVAIATPVHTHYDLGMKALGAGKHVFMEKPLASSSEQGLKLLEAAQKNRKVLFVDHTFLYTGAVQKIKELVGEGRLGRIYYYDSVRVNLGLFQHDINVLWDLAVHDLSIMDFVLAKRPAAVSAVGISHIPGKPEDIAYLTCFFEDDLLAHIHTSWLAPVKIRQTLIGGDKQMIVYDDVQVAEKVKVYDRGVKVSDDPTGIYKLLVDYRSGDIWAPHLDNTEALQKEAALFVKAVETGLTPPSDGKAGLRIVRILEAASRSMAEKGRVVDLEWDKLGL